MESKVKLLGHPLHPVLIVFPLGLLAMAVLFDVFYLISRDSEFAVVAFWMIIAGLVVGLAAAVVGFGEWQAVPGDTRARSIGASHGLGNVVVVVLFLVSWILRRNEPGYAPDTLALVFSFGGALLAMATGWLGGELVYRLAVGVDEGAHLNAPSSLSDEPASGSTAARAVAGYTVEEHARASGHGVVRDPVTGETRADVTASRDIANRERIERRQAAREAHEGDDGPGVPGGPEGTYRDGPPPTTRPPNDATRSRR